MKLTSLAALALNFTEKTEINKSSMDTMMLLSHATLKNDFYECKYKYLAFCKQDHNSG